MSMFWNGKKPPLLLSMIQAHLDGIGLVATRKLIKYSEIIFFSV